MISKSGIIKTADAFLKVFVDFDSPQRECLEFLMYAGRTLGNTFHCHWKSLSLAGKNDHCYSSILQMLGILNPQLPSEDR